MASHLEQALDQADAHITLTFVDASLNPEPEQMVRISEISKPPVNANKPGIIAAASTISRPPMDVVGANLKALEAKATSDEISKPLLNNVKEPACIARTSTSAASMDAIDMKLKGVKESEGAVVSLITTVGKRKRCFAQTDDRVAKVCKPNIGVQVQKNVTSEISKSVLCDGLEPCTNAATSPSTPSMDAIDMYLKGVNEKRPVASLPTTTLNSCFAQTGPVPKLRKTKICLQVSKKLRHLTKADESLKSGDRAMKRYIKLLDMDLPGGDRSSVRDACLALNPLLNTNNLSKIECFMRHRGLHVLYEMLRYFLPIFEGRPVLRKLMKALQHLHDPNRLGVEHMACDAPRFCMLKFSKLLFDLSEHEDPEVRTRARSFQGLRFSIPKMHPSHAKCCSWERRTRH